MKVEIIDYTRNAVDKLIYTKETRLTLGQDTRERIAKMSEAEKMEKLRYMAGTIPSSWEFVHYTFEITGVSRAFAEQFKRTRTGSYAQQTLRMLEVGDFEYETGPTVEEGVIRTNIYQRTMAVINDAYKSMIGLGAKAEDARGVLPLNIHTNLIAEFNLRTLSEMVKKRSGQRTQGEYRKVLDAMKAEVYRVHPWAIWFLEPDHIQKLKELEQLVELAKCEHVIDNDQAINLHKIIDQLRAAL